MYKSKCSPWVTRTSHHDGNDGKSCFSTDALIKIAKAYNESIMYGKTTDKYKELAINTQTRNRNHYIRELNKRLNQMCSDEICWLRLNFVKNLNDREINDLTFLPKGPNVGRKWLSTTDINNVMEQYQHIYSGYTFLGAVPIDFDDIPFFGIKELDFNSLENQGITHIGVVFNLDEHYKSGSHWVSMFIDFKKDNIYYFDSYGTMPDKRVIRFIKRIKDYITIHKRQPDVYINSNRHQYKNSECGVYSINFILRLLKGESFDYIVKNKTSDDQVNVCRDKYFRGED